ncbi:MAG: hypothetical protein ACK4TJ_04205 [Tabrizicola sp.]
MSRYLLIVTLFLAACGADGAPEPPSRGLAITGEVQMGVVTR